MVTYTTRIPLGIVNLAQVVEYIVTNNVGFEPVSHGPYHYEKGMAVSPEEARNMLEDPNYRWHLKELEKRRVLTGYDFTNPQVESVEINLLEF
ncbi:hypothetical protein A3K63_04320 [Candidatus Micrarchaeota archaeon RBG_16_49_10]|nr:MAG: hypothetical protein A3K63_04320 [Candidatus Micrarchaeota archaeon RBG_16_49_10]